MPLSPALRLLLVSNSTVAGRGYLDHVAEAVKAFLSDRVKRVLFVPYALADRDGYAAKARMRFEALGYGLDSIHEAADPKAAVLAAEAVFVGGGNTWRLLKALYDHDVLDALKSRAGAGMPYIGSSAGSGIAAPTIRTTNDMPICEPPSFRALSLVPFQLNLHYLDPHPKNEHMGETREERLLQYLEEWPEPVAGLREGSWLEVANGVVTLRGFPGARVFRRGGEPVEVAPDSELTDVLGL